MPSGPLITADAPPRYGFHVVRVPSDHVAFWMLAATHVLIWVVVPSLTEHNLSLDALEMISWGREWQLGYHKHPPLPAWIAEASCLLLGNAPWGIYLAAQLCVVTCFWSAWQLGRQLLQPWHAVCAAFVLEASHYYTFTTPELNNNVVSRAFWALAIVWLFRALQGNQRRMWAAAGICLGLGLLSKYDTAILAAVMLIFGLAHPAARKQWKSVGPWLMLATALLTVLPHFVWLWNHDFPTIGYALRRSIVNSSTGLAQPGPQDTLLSLETITRHLWNPIAFLLRQIPAMLPTILISASLLALPLRLKKWNRDEALQRSYLLAMVLGPLALILCISLVTGIRVRSMWGSALWTFTGVATLYFFELRERDDWYAVGRTLGACVVVSVIMSTALAVRNVASPHVAQRGSRIHFPGRELAIAVEQAWNQRDYGALRSVGGTWWTAGNVGFYGQRRYSVYGSLSPRQSPWLSDKEFHRTGGVIVWQVGKELDYEPKKLRQHFPDLETSPPVSIPWATAANVEPLRFGIAIVPPLELPEHIRDQRPVEMATRPQATSH